MPTAPAPRSPDLGLRPLEIAWGLPYGRAPEAPPLGSAAGPNPRTAIEAVVDRALRRPPCVVAFSGGRDSSVILAIATAVARREGHALPVPVTNRFPGDDDAEESAWQEAVVAHLGLADWDRRPWRDELEILGPYAQRALARHGLLAPFNAHFLLPVFECAGGGTVLTGFGGDELFDEPARRAARAVLRERRLPHRDELRGAAFGFAPHPVRALARSLALPFHRFDWIRPRARRRLALGYSAWLEREPLTWAGAIREWWWPSRRVQVTLRGLAALAAGEGVRAVHPFADPGLLAAYAATGDARGPSTRADGLHALAGDLLPPFIVARDTKADFTRAFFGERARAFAGSWSGTGVNPALVDPDRLRRHWLEEEKTDGHSYSLLQQAWLAGGDHPQQGGDARPDGGEVALPLKAPEG